MDIPPIRNDADHREALMEIDRLWNALANTPEGDKFDVLITLVEAYEAKRRPAKPVSSRDILEYAVTDMGRSQKELADVLGSRSQASDLLRGRRNIALVAAQKISAAWRSPVQRLLAPYEVEVA